jgi:hypothetical protein
MKPRVTVHKEADGRWLIRAVSTAAIKDRSNETFDTEAMDYDAEMARVTGEYPEFRVFHSGKLGIGKVEKMERVGIFAVDTGHSYDDPFSNWVCENWLAKNDGKWRVSRGFYVIEAKGDCPSCGSGLVVSKEHMQVGFRCPVCKQVHISYKGVLKELHFRKTRTFDVTVTDIPCVPFTGVSASKPLLEDVKIMTKEELRKRLKEAGVPEAMIDARLAQLSDAQLKEFDGIPDAVLLKEFGEDSGEEDTQTFTLDTDVLKQFSDIVDQRLTALLPEALKEVLSQVEIDLSAEDGVNLKEVPGIDALTEKLDALTDMVTALKEALETDERQRLKEVVEAAPRNGKLRIMRFKQDAACKPGSKKAAKPFTDDMDDEEDDEDMAEEKEEAILDIEGNAASSMTEFILGGGK